MAAALSDLGRSSTKSSSAHGGASPTASASVSAAGASPFGAPATPGLGATPPADAAAEDLSSSSSDSGDDTAEISDELSGVKVLQPPTAEVGFMDVGLYVGGTVEDPLADVLDWLSSTKYSPGDGGLQSSAGASSGAGAGGMRNAPGRCPRPVICHDPAAGSGYPATSSGAPGSLWARGGAINGRTGSKDASLREETSLRHQLPSARLARQGPRHHAPPFERHTNMFNELRGGNSGAERSSSSTAAVAAAAAATAAFASAGMPPATAASSGGAAAVAMGEHFDRRLTPRTASLAANAAKAAALSMAERGHAADGAGALKDGASGGGGGGGPVGCSAGAPCAVKEDNVEKDFVDEEEQEWDTRQRKSGTVGRLVMYHKGDRPKEDIVLRGGGGRRHIVVAGVRDGGQAARVGVRAGDRLVSIDGKKNFLGLPADTVREMLEAPVVLVFLGFVGKLQAEVRLTTTGDMCGIATSKEVLKGTCRTPLLLEEERILNAGMASLFLTVDDKAKVVQQRSMAPPLFELRRAEANGLVKRALERMQAQGDAGNTTSQLPPPSYAAALAAVRGVAAAPGDEADASPSSSWGAGAGASSGAVAGAGGAGAAVGDLTLAEDMGDSPKTSMWTRERGGDEAHLIASELTPGEHRHDGPAGASPGAASLQTRTSASPHSGGGGIGGAIEPDDLATSLGEGGQPRTLEMMLDLHDLAIGGTMIASA